MGYPLSVKQIRKVVGVNTLSLCYKIGSVLGRKNYLSSLVKLTNGIILFDGIVSKIRTKDNQGFLSGFIEFKGQDNFVGKTAKVFLKNESLILWINNKVKLTCPDLTCLINKKAKLGIYNRDLKTGQKVIILGIPSLPIWRTKKGQKLFGPRTFGFNFKPVLLPHTVAW